MPDAGNINGSPETTAAKFLVNGGTDLNSNTSIYFNAAYVYKKVNSFANYRTPYWRTLADYPYLADFFGDGTPQSYVGYVPTFDGDLGDYNATIGFKSLKNDWSTDVSLTLGGNQQTYTVRNSHNRNTAGLRNPDTYLGDLDSDGVVDADEIVQGTLKYLENSPVTFRDGGTRFNHIVGNIDISRPLNSGQKLLKPSKETLHLMKQVVLIHLQETVMKIPSSQIDTISVDTCLSDLTLPKTS
jgi:iron complex outermembrane receptor protein